MADVNSVRRADSRSDAPDPPQPDEAELFQLIELMFFAYRDFVSDPDAILSEFGFGRAHHRVLHFVNRNPGLRVADLLDILKITKQSLGRVLKQLVDEGFVYQEAGTRDRRQRLLYPTALGSELARRLALPQFRRFRRVISEGDPGDVAAARRFLISLVDPDDRRRVAALLAGGRGSGQRQAEG